MATSGAGAAPLATRFSMFFPAQNRTRRRSYTMTSAPVLGFRAFRALVTHTSKIPAVVVEAPAGFDRFDRGAYSSWHATMDKEPCLAIKAAA